MNANDLIIWPVFHQNKRCATLLFFSHTFCDIISAPSFYDLSFEMSKKIILCKSTFTMLVISYLRNLFQENIWLFNDLAFNFKGSQLMIITKVIMWITTKKVMKHISMLITWTNFLNVWASTCHTVIIMAAETIIECENNHKSFYDPNS